MIIKYLQKIFDFSTISKKLEKSSPQKEELSSCCNEDLENQTSENPNIWRYESEILELIYAFESRLLPLSHWTHFAHLTVGVYYLRAYGLDAAFQRLKNHIIAYNESVGVPNSPERGYHETITLFWLKWLFFNVLEQNQSSKTLKEICNSLADLDKNILLEYYSLDIIKSPLARQTWIEPDRKEIFDTNI